MIYGIKLRRDDVEVDRSGAETCAMEAGEGCVLAGGSWGDGSCQCGSACAANHYAQSDGAKIAYQVSGEG